jgi:hypothetical protein
MPVVTSSLRSGRRSNRERRALAHRDDGGKLRQRRGRRVQVGERRVEHDRFGAAGQRRPVSQRQGDVLVVVENGDAQCHIRLLRTGISLVVQGVGG